MSVSQQSARPSQQNPYEKVTFPFSPWLKSSSSRTLAPRFVHVHVHVSSHTVHRTPHTTFVTRTVATSQRWLDPRPRHPRGSGRTPSAIQIIRKRKLNGVLLATAMNRAARRERAQAHKRPPCKIQNAKGEKEKANGERRNEGGSGCPMNMKERRGGRGG